MRALPSVGGSESGNYFHVQETAHLDILLFAWATTSSIVSFSSSWPLRPDWHTLIKLFWIWAQKDWCVSKTANEQDADTVGRPVPYQTYTFWTSSRCAWRSTCTAGRGRRWTYTRVMPRPQVTRRFRVRWEKPGDEATCDLDLPSSATCMTAQWSIMSMRSETLCASKSQCGVKIVKRFNKDCR